RGAGGPARRRPPGAEGGGRVSSLPAPPEGLRERLQGYARLVSLVAEQLEALEHGEAVRLRELAEERAALEAELRGEGDGDTLPDLLAEGVQAVEEHLTGSEVLRSRWTSLEAGALRATRAVRPGHAPRGRYLDPSALATQLDVRL